MAEPTLKDVIDKITAPAKPGAAGLATEPSLHSIDKKSTGANEALLNIAQNLATLSAVTINDITAQRGAQSLTQANITRLAKLTDDTRTTISGSQSAFNLRSIQIDPETGSGIATALAFSTFPGLAKLYVRGVEALADAFDSIEPEHLATLKENAGSFEAMTQVIGVVQALNFKDLLGASIVLRMTAGKLGENLGAMFVNLMDGIARGLPAGMLQDLGNSETPLSKITNSFSSIVGGLTSLIQINGLKLLGQTLLFRILAGQIGRNIGFGFVKLVKGMPSQADLDKIKQGLNTINSSISKLDIFENFKPENILRGFSALGKMGDILSKIKAKDFTKLNEILGAFWGQLVTRIKHLKETLKQIKAIPDAWWTSFSSGMSHLYAAGQKVKKLRVDTFKRFPKVISPFSENKDVLMNGLRDLKAFAKGLKQISFTKLNLGMLGLTLLGTLSIPAGLAFTIMLPLWKPIQFGLKSLISIAKALKIAGAAMASALPAVLKITGVLLLFSSGIAASIGVIAASIMLFGKSIGMFSEGLNQLANINLDNFNPIQFLKTMGAIASGILLLVPATIFIPLVAGGLQLLGWGLRGLTKDLDVAALMAVALSLESMDKSLGGLTKKSLSILFLGFSLRSLGKSLRIMIEDLNVSAMDSIANLFSELKGLFSQNITKSAFDEMSEGLESIIDVIDDISFDKTQSLVNLLKELTNAISLTAPAAAISSNASLEITPTAVSPVGAKLSARGPAAAAAPAIIKGGDTIVNNTSSSVSNSGGNTFGSSAIQTASASAALGGSIGYTMA